MLATLTIYGYIVATAAGALTFWTLARPGRQDRPTATGRPVGRTLPKAA